MSTLGPKASSVRMDGAPDGFEIPTAWRAERDPRGQTRLVASAPPDGLRRALPALIGALRPPLQVLYRQIVDRRDPKPQGGPSRDFVGLGLDAAEVLGAVAACDTLVYHDARGELWVRDADGAQVVLDCDGLLFTYPDDLGFRDALTAAGIAEAAAQTVAERDYVRHAFVAAADLDEDALIARLHLTEVPPQARTGALY